jgi:hypothetical protein
MEGHLRRVLGFSPDAILSGPGSVGSGQAGWARRNASAKAPRPWRLLLRSRGPHQGDLGKQVPVHDAAIVRPSLPVCGQQEEDHSVGEHGQAEERGHDHRAVVLVEVEEARAIEACSHKE